MLSHYEKGYCDGFRLKCIAFKHESMAAYEEYYKGWAKGKEEKEFCEAYSDETLGVEGYGP